ncbi:MAG: NAD(P)H-quinone oxidoreductase [Anaerolineae bacterium]
MKAILYDRPGAPEVLYYGDAPDPIPAEGELLIRVHATALNRADLLQRAGGYNPPSGASPILGLELAGEVLQAAHGFKAGDRVMGVVTGGAYAQIAALPAGMAMPIPETYSFVEAAAIPEAFLTAYLNLFTLGHLKKGESVLIHAGASGVGTAAIQLAKAAGAQIFATAGSDQKLALCRELGAEHTIHYKTDSFSQRVLEATQQRGVDMILDFIGAPYWNDNLTSLAVGGRLLMIGMMGGSVGELALSAILPKSLTIAGTTLRRTPLHQKIQLTRDFLDFGRNRLENRALRPIIDRIFPLEQAADAHRYMHSNANSGKIVLNVS